MSTTLKIVLGMLAAGGFALLSLIVVTKAALKVAMCAVAATAAAGLFLYVAFTGPDPLPMFTGMVVFVGSFGCFLRSLFGLSEALSELEFRPAGWARRLLDLVSA